MSRSLRTYNQFSQEDLLVRVESVDDQVHQLTDLGLEAESMKQFTHQSRFRNILPQSQIADLPKGLCLSGHFVVYFVICLG